MIFLFLNINVEIFINEGCYILERRHWRLLVRLGITGLLLVVILGVLLGGGLFVSAQNDWWDTRFSSRQLLTVPVSFEEEEAWFQPVDLPVVLSDPCWAKDTRVHSVRVVVQQGSMQRELASQVYGLSFFDDQLLRSCHVVFLIPEGLDASARFFVYYDDGPHPAADYQDHVRIEEAYYRYEPLSGYPIESAYYAIRQDDTVVYALSQEGEFLGYSTGQHVTKHEENTTEVAVDNGELFAAFDFRYYYGDGLYDYSATSEQLVSKKVLVDGPLMVSCLLRSRSVRGEVETSCVYTYYYCPTAAKRIRAQVTHAFQKESRVDPSAETDGIFAELQCGRVRSTAISYLNFGTIYPFVHVHTEQGVVEQYGIDTDPEYIPDDPDIRILSSHDDVDLGEEAWMCFSQKTTGEAHALILNTTDVVVSGREEASGAQVKAWAMDYPHLPGFENDMVRIQFGRNSYEPGQERDLTIPEDLVISYTGEFFSTPTGGPAAVAREAALFQQLIRSHSIPPVDENATEEQQKTANLTVVVHNARSFPLGPYLSTISQRRFSSITVELFHNATLLSSATADRVSFQSDPDRMVRVDWRNLSFFKQARFLDISQGEYMVKVFRENPLQGGRMLIGSAVTTLSSDTRLSVFCTAEAAVELSLVDQHSQPVQDVSVVLLQQGCVLSENTTDKNGMARLSAPVHHRTPYLLQVRYQGAGLYEKSIRLGLLRRFVPIQRMVSFSRYQLGVQVYDT